MYTAGSYELHAPLIVENADSLTAATYTSAYVSLSDYHRAFLDINVGEMQAGATLDVQILQATSAAGAGAKVIADKSGTGNKAITQLTQAGGDGDDLLRIELQTEELDVTGAFEFVAVQVVVANAAVELGYVLYGNQARYKPTPTTNWTEVVD